MLKHLVIFKIFKLIWSSIIVMVVNFYHSLINVSNNVLVNRNGTIQLAFSWGSVSSFQHFQGTAISARLPSAFRLLRLLMCRSVRRPATLRITAPQYPRPFRPVPDSSRQPAVITWHRRLLALLASQEQRRTHFQRSEPHHLYTVNSTSLSTLRSSRLDRLLCQPQVSTKDCFPYRTTPVRPGTSIMYHVCGLVL